LDDMLFMLLFIDTYVGGPESREGITCEAQSPKRPFTCGANQ